MRHSLGLLGVIAVTSVGMFGCEGPAGSDGQDGVACWDLNGNGTGDVGSEDRDGNGAVNVADCIGANAVDRGTISGTVRDGAGAGVAGVTVATVPADLTTVTAANGTFSLEVPIGYYTVVATHGSYNTATLGGVGVAAGSTTSVNLDVSLANGTLVSLNGRVTNTAGVAVAGATVAIAGTALQATTAADGTYTLASVPAPGPYFLDVTPPAGGTYLAADTRRSVSAPYMTNAVEDLKLSARPTNAATYVGRSVCEGCHVSQAAQHVGSGHWRSLTQDLTRLRYAAKWPALSGTVATGINALDPATCTGSVPVYACQNAAGVYAFKFGGADCADVTGTVIPVSGTYGGEGDHGIENQSNVGRWKQRYFAKLADVPSAAGWTYASTADKARDYLILPIQVTESGDNSASGKWGAYKNTEWCLQSRTFARACAGCHNTGLSIAYTQDAAATITAFNYIDFNVSCEKCHGPGSEHRLGGGRANKIINPKYLSASAERQVCGQCHAADAGKSAVVVPSTTTKFAYAYNPAHAAEVGGGWFVPGVYDVSAFISNLTSGGFDAWPDGKHGKAHRQQYSELSGSIHVNNSSERLTCSSCHDVHSLYQGPAAYEMTSGSDEWVLTTPRLQNNTVCLGCHAGSGSFLALTKDEVAAVHAGSPTATTVTKNGAAQSYTQGEIDAAKAAIAATVIEHMNHGANMGYALVYAPDVEPGVGRCSSCHMPNTGKSGDYTTGLDDVGKTALVEGDQASHRFDIIVPQVSRAMVAGAAGDDKKIMPNSCSKCHTRYRFSADAL